MAVVNIGHYYAEWMPCTYDTAMHECTAPLRSAIE